MEGITLGEVMRKKKTHPRKLNREEFLIFIVDTITDVPISEFAILQGLGKRLQERPEDGWHAPGTCTQVGSFIYTVISERQELAWAQISHFLKVIQLLRGRASFKPRK